MAQNYEDIVRKWYERLRPQFQRMLTAKYPGLTLYDAEDLYQDAFIAIQENLLKGTVREDTSWTSYIMTIGMNLASKRWRKEGKVDSTDTMADGSDDDKPMSPTARKVEDILKTLSEGDIPLYKDPEALSLLGNEITHSPEPCASIILLYYGWDDEPGLSMKEIAQRVGLKNADTAKAKKSQCMTDLIRRVSEAFKRAGYNLTPKKRNRNGKN